MGRSIALLVAVAVWQSAAPLPDKEAFLAEARTRLASNPLLQSRYTYRERVTSLRLNPFGEMGTGPVELYEVYPMPDDALTYRRLIARDGIAASPAALAARDRQFLARYAQWQRELAREGQTERDARANRQAIARARDRAQAEEAVGLFDFTLVRRDTFDGAPAIVVAFKPRAGARPRTREARVAGSFAGEAWVHEHDYEVMKVEAQAVVDTAFGFGIIARLHKGAAAEFIRRKVDGVWLPVSTRVTGTGRALLFRKITINYVREYFDYRPFDPAELPAMLGASTGSR